MKKITMSFLILLVITSLGFGKANDRKTNQISEYMKVWGLLKYHQTQEKNCLLHGQI